MSRPLGASQALRDRARTNVESGQMPDVASIYRPGTSVPTSDFGSNVTYSLSDTVSANYWTISGSEAIVLERMDVRAEITVIVPALTDITEKDQIVYEVTETGKILHLEVSHVHTRSRPNTLKVSCIQYKFDNP